MTLTLDMTNELDIQVLTDELHAREVAEKHSIPFERFPWILAKDSRFIAWLGEREIAHFSEKDSAVKVAKSWPESTPGQPFDVSIKNYRSCRGHDGADAWSADLCVNGKTVAHVRDDSWGGELDFEYLDRSGHYRGGGLVPGGMCSKIQGWAHRSEASTELRAEFREKYGAGGSGPKPNPSEFAETSAYVDVAIDDLVNAARDEAFLQRARTLYYRLPDDEPGAFRFVKMGRKKAQRDDAKAIAWIKENVPGAIILNAQKPVDDSVGDKDFLDSMRRARTLYYRLPTDEPRRVRFVVRGRKKAKRDDREAVEWIKKNFTNAIILNATV